MNNMMYGSRKRGIGGGNFQGRFGGRPKRFRSSKLFRGFAERVTFASHQDANSCCYLGFSSIPTISSGGFGATNPGYSRLLADICISILRDFFRYHFPGHLEFETPDQAMFDGSIDKYTINLRSSEPASLLGYTDTTIFSGASAATTSLRDVANNLANSITAFWRVGQVPQSLYAFQTSTAATGGVPLSYMWLNNLVVKCSVVNVITVQNQTLADDAVTGDGDANTITDVTANPLRGRVFYLKDIAPVVGVGRQIGTNGDKSDMWGHQYLRNFAEAGSTLGNVLAPSNQLPATGCWKVIPKPEYFKNCRKVKDIGLEPGVQKTLKMRFNFRGTFTDFLSGEYNNYAIAQLDGLQTTTNNGLALQSGLKSGFGQLALLVFEKRLRQTGSLITVAYQVDSYIRASVFAKRQFMTYHVETNV